MLFYTWSLVLLLGESYEFGELFAVRESGCAAFVTMMKPADLGERDDFSLFGRLNWAHNRAVHCE